MALEVGDKAPAFSLATDGGGKVTLASLKGNAQLLGEALPSGSLEKAKAERVIGEAVRLEALTNDLLAFVRSGTIHRRAADPVKVLRDALDAIGDPRFQVDAASAPGRWSRESYRREQGRTNVLVNAVQASPEGAPIDVRV